MKHMDFAAGNCVECTTFTSSVFSDLTFCELAEDSAHDPTLNDPTFYGKMSPLLFEQTYKTYVNANQTGLRLSCISHATFPMNGTLQGMAARAQRATKTWVAGGSYSERILLLQDHNNFHKQENGNSFSILFHTDGFYTVKVIFLYFV